MKAVSNKKSVLVFVPRTDCLLLTVFRAISSGNLNKSIVHDFEIPRRGQGSRNANYVISVSSFQGAQQVFGQKKVGLSICPNSPFCLRFSHVMCARREEIYYLSGRGLSRKNSVISEKSVTVTCLFPLFQADYIIYSMWYFETSEMSGDPAKS
jgi:hypothetical protein